MHQGSFINGRWVTSGSNRLEVISPIDDRCVFSTVFGDDHADQAIAAAGCNGPEAVTQRLNRGFAPQGPKSAIGGPSRDCGTLPS